MIHNQFWPFYDDGTEVRIGDLVRSAGGPVRVITSIFPPNDEQVRLRGGIVIVSDIH